MINQQEGLFGFIGKIFQIFEKSGQAIDTITEVQKLQNAEKQNDERKTAEKKELASSPV